MEQKNQDKHIQELLLLQRVAQKINSILDLDILLEEIVGDVAETFGYSRSGVLFIDNEANELEIVAVRGWTINYHVKGDRFKIGKFGMIGHTAAIGETYYAPDVTIDPYYQVSENSTRSEVDIPLKINGELIGIFDIQHQEANAFSPGRIKLLESLAHHIEIAIENARLFQKERLEKERMQSELKDARAIQFNLFPKESPIIPGFNLKGVCLPCLEVGGDWYDFFPLDNGKLGIVLADVSGKGMGAALLMSSTRSLLRLVANLHTGRRAQTLSPGKVLKKLNEILLTDFPSTRFVTMIYALLDPEERTIIFSSAGHTDPLFVNLPETNFVSKTDGLPLGITGSDYSEHKIKFTPGCKFVLYSDGVTEAMNTFEEEFGNDRLEKHFSVSSASIQSIINEVNNFSQGKQQSDDITVVIIGAE